MREAVDKWILSHEKEVNDAVEQVVKDGAGVALLRGFDVFFEQSMFMPYGIT